MSEARKVPDGAERASLEAAAWVIAHDEGLTPAQQDEFLQWLAADPQHQECFARQRQTWRDFNLLAEWRPEHSAEPNPDLLARPRRRARRLWLLSGTLAAAASVALVWILGSSGSGTGGDPAPMEFAASAYDHRVLEDGSAIDMNSGARLRVQYAPEERRIVLLRGEAQFTVAHDPARPFVVRVGEVDVRAVGTAFNVRLEAGNVEVLVTEGKVQLERSSAPSAARDPVEGSSPGAGATSEPALAALVAGQRTVIPPGGNPASAQILPVTAVDLGRLLAWQPRLLDFNSTPLGEVVAEFNRLNRVQLVVADAELLGLPIVASFRSDNIEGFVRLLEVTARVRVARPGPERIVLHKER